MITGTAKRALGDDSHCGDQYGYWQKEKRTTLCIVDGLGHGKHAETAAKAAIDYVAGHLSESLYDIFAGCNREIRDTRGVAMGIAVIDENKELLTYSGVGNTRIIIVKNGRTDVEKKTLRLVSSYGIVGGGYKRLSSESVPFMPGDQVIMFTDGVVEMIDLSGYGDGLRSDATQFAEKIIQDWGRDTDDAAVLIYRL